MHLYYTLIPAIKVIKYSGTLNFKYRLQKQKSKYVH